MKNLLKKFSLEKFNKNIKISFLRFPISFISSVLAFFVLEFLVYNWDFLSQIIESIILKSILSLITVYFLSIWIYLLSEKFNFSRLKTCFIQILSIIFWILFYFSFEQNLLNNFFEEEIIYIIITLVWVISFIFISSFIKNIFDKNINNDKYYTFFNEISSKILMSTIVWVSLMILGFIALWSIFSLFDISSFINEWNFYWYWATFSLSLFTTIYFLVILPENKENTILLDKIKENKFYNFLSNYIALPFIIIYFIILYSYTTKVLMNFNSWPKWIISWMVIWFSLFWYLIYIFSYAFEIKSTLVRIFRKVFPFAVLFQTPMLFYAIYLRINQYDFTINRYLVLVFWIFLVIISLYFIFSRKKYLLFTPFLLTTFIIIISLLPWWVYNFPESRQLELLGKDLTEAKVLKNSTIILPKDFTYIEAKLSWKIYEEVSYICDFHGCDSMKNILWKVLDNVKKEDKIEWTKNHNDEILRIEKEIEKYPKTDLERIKTSTKELENLKKQIYTWIESWNYKTKLIEKLKVRVYNIWLLENQKYINFHIDYNITNNLIKISNYDYIIDILWDKIPWDLTINKKNPLYSVRFNIDNEKLVVYNYDNILEEFKLIEDFKSIYEKNINNVSSYWEVILKEPLILEKIWKKVNIKIILDNFWIKNPKYTWTDYYNTNLNWKVLLKEIK